MNDDTRQWRKSSYSGTSANCVEVCTSQPGTVGVRDSKDVLGPELAVSDQAWARFVQRIKGGEFSL
jgi:Domain of unknown function (DUF397)